LQYFFHLIRIDASFALIPFNITGSQVKLLEFGHGPPSTPGGGDGLAPVAFVTFIFVIPTVHWRAEMPFVMRGIVV
jgi:hypothetical protein